jgi:hypothetical protein
MTTRQPATPNAGEPWQWRVLKGGDDLPATAANDASNHGVANDAADLSAREPLVSFLPRFQRTPDGKEWS